MPDNDTPASSVTDSETDLLSERGVHRASPSGVLSEPIVWTVTTVVHELACRFPTAQAAETRLAQNKQRGARIHLALRGEKRLDVF